MIYIGTKNGERRVFEPEFNLSSDEEARQVCEAEFMTAMSMGGDPGPIRIFKQISTK